jgi:predicted ArsR family transcriptional regulator
LMIPLHVRKDLGVHPEAFRRLLSDLDAFDLISVRAMPRRRPVHLPRAMPLRLARGIELTRQGENVLELAREVRETVRRWAPLLPVSSSEHWLSTAQRGPPGGPRSEP